MKKVLLVLTILLFNYSNLISQCDGVEDGGTCGTAFSLCGPGEITNQSIDMSMGSPPGQGQPGSICNGGGVINNVTWITFIAGATTITFELLVTNCTDNGFGPGIQYGVFNECDFSSSVVCNAGVNLGVVVVTADTYEIGNQYTLFIDGIGGSICDVEFTITQGDDQYQVPDTDPPVNNFDGVVFDPPLVGNEICEGATVNFSTEPGNASNPDWYKWTIDPPSIDYPTGEINPGNAEDFSYDIEFNELGVFTICGFAYNCCDTSNTECLDFEVVPLPDEPLGTFDVCFNELELGFIPPGWDGPVIFNAGSQFVMLEDPAYTCGYSQSATINMIPPQPAQDAYSLQCEFVNGFAIEVCNVIYNAPSPSITQQVVTCPGADINGCDSTIFLTADFLNVQAILEDPECVNGNLEFSFIGGGWLSLQFATITYTLLLDGTPIWTELSTDFNFFNDKITVPLVEGVYYLEISVEKLGQECIFATNMINASGTELFPEDPELDVWALNPCIQDSVSYQLNGNNDPSNIYLWNVNPSNGLVIEDDSTTTIGINWSGADITQAYTICVEADNGCGKSDPICETIDVIGQPLASYSLPDTVCIVDAAIVEYNGTSITDGDYIWNFDGGDIGGADPNGPGSFNINYSTTGTKYISLLVNQGTCISEIYIDSIIVVDLLAAPVINCSSAVDSIGFTWADIADDYIVNVLDAPPGAIFNQNGASFSVTGLNPLDSVEIEVIAVDNGFCPNVSTILQCIAQNCLPVDIALPVVDTICLDASAMSIDLNAVVNPVSNIAIEEWNGTGIIDIENGIFDPSVSLAGVHQIVYSYLDGDCPYTDALEIVVLEQPIGTFEVEDTICIADFVTVNYSGTFSSGEFIWDFGGGLSTGSGSAPFDISWDTPGLKTVTLLVSNGKCESEMVTREIIVQEELEAPIINCAEQTNDITFTWNDVDNATEYEVFINSNSQGTQTGTSFFVDGLEPGNMVDISVVAISDNKCPNVSNFTSCMALNCPPVIVTIGAPFNIICLTPATTPIQLTSEIIGGDSDASITYSGPGVDQSGLFDPQTAGLGMHEIVLAYELLNCSQSDTILLTILPTPEASFTTQSSICITDTFIIDFDGSFDVSADFIWDLDGGTISGIAPGPFKIWYDTPGSYNISLELDEATCLSAPFIQMVTVEEELFLPAPGFDCDPSTGEINFSWPAVDCASEYIVFVNNVQVATVTDLNYEVSDLSDDEIVDFEIIAVSECACGDVNFSTSCSTLACPNLTTILDNVAGICLDESAGNVTLNATITGNPTVTSETWSGPGVNSGVFNPNNAGVGTHTIEYSFEIENCAYSESISIEVFDVPEAEVLFIDPSCPGETDGSIEVNGSGGDGNYTIFVNNVEQVNNIIENLDGAAYSIMVVDGNNCSYSETIVLTAPGTEVATIQGNTFVIAQDTNSYTVNSGIATEDITNITWFDTTGTILCNDPSCISILFAAEDDVTICALVEYGNGCSTEACIDIRAEKIKQVYIPNIFTPNDDGVNDFWLIKPGDEVVTIPLVQVYNRWGEKMFEDVDILENLSQGWDGNYKGSSLNPGVYVYKILVVYKDGTPETLTGDITIVK